MKTVALIGGVACASFATHTPPLDSRLRGNDELRGRNDECEGIPTNAGMTNSVAGTVHPGSESGTCFRTNRSCRLVPAHQGMKMGPGRWKCLGVVGATLPLWIPAPYRGTGHAFDRRNDGTGDWWDSEALSKPSNTIFVPITYRFTISASSLLLCSPTGASGRLPVSLPGPPPLRRPLRR